MQPREIQLDTLTPVLKLGSATLRASTGEAKPTAGISALSPLTEADTGKGKAVHVHMRPTDCKAHTKALKFLSVLHC